VIRFLYRIYVGVWFVLLNFVLKNLYQAEKCAVGIYVQACMERALDDDAKNNKRIIAGLLCLL